MQTPEQIAERILDQIVRGQMGIEDIAALIRAYGDARVRAEQGRIIGLIQAQPPAVEAPDEAPAEEDSAPG